MQPARVRAIIGEVTEAVVEWPAFAERAGIPAANIRAIGETHRLDLAA